MRRELEGRGILSSHIIDETASNNTFEQLCALVRLFMDMQFKKALLVSNDWHLPRIEAFVQSAPELELLRTLPLDYISAESVLLEKDAARWGKLISGMRAAPEMKQRLLAEAEGVRQIHAGTYHYKKKYEKAD